MQETEKTTTSTLEFNVNVKMFNKEKGELVDAIAAGSKLTKADSGREAAIIEDWLDVRINPSNRVNEMPYVSVHSHSKLTKADSRKAVEPAPKA